MSERSVLAVFAVALGAAGAVGLAAFHVAGSSGERYLASGRLVLEQDLRDHVDERSRAVARILEGLELANLERLRARVGYLVDWALPDPAGREAWLDGRYRGAREAARRKAAALGSALRDEELAALREALAGQRDLARVHVRSAARPVALAASLLAGGGLLLVALTALLGRRLSVSRPLGRLAETMDRVAAGGDERLAAVGAPDVRRTITAFNGMVDALASTRRDLRGQVEAKTAALGEALDEQRGLNRRLTKVLDELESAQERLVRQEKMAAIGTLAGGVAHEFNNVLGGIRGCADDALQDAADPDVRESLAIIRRAADRGRRITDGLLRFSQAAAREPAVLDLRTVARECAELLASESERRGVALRLDVPDELSVLADPVEIHQVLHNLVLNAVQASPEGREVALEGRVTGGSVELRVLDRGPGIPDEDATRVFEPFFTTREREGGTGLGLAITHGIVQGLGGELTFEPRAGGGTVFRLRLPRAGAREG